jgi:hypothetical protein
MFHKRGLADALAIFTLRSTGRTESAVFRLDSLSSRTIAPIMIDVSFATVFGNTGVILLYFGHGLSFLWQPTDCVDIKKEYVLPLSHVSMR